MSERVFVITGSNIGLGYHCAHSLASKKAGIIVLACRNVPAANKAKETIKEETGYDNVVVLPEPLDLSDLTSVRAYSASLVKWLKEVGVGHIFALINNAGVGGNPSFPKNKEGHDLVFTTNHLGHFLFTMLLLPYIQSTIVNVSSEVHNHDSTPHLPDPSFMWPSNEEEYHKYLLEGNPINDENPFVSGMRRYCRSKLCNVFFTNELALRLSGDIPAYLDKELVPLAESLKGRGENTLPQAKKLRVIAFNPGLMLDTNFISPEFKKRFEDTDSAVKRTGPVSGERLARLSMGEIEGSRSAAFFSDEGSHPSSVFSRSRRGIETIQKELWKYSIQWSGVTGPEMEAAGF